MNFFEKIFIITVFNKYIRNLKEVLSLVVIPREEQPALKKAWFTYSLILINIIVYVYTSYNNLLLTSTNESIYKLGFIPQILLEDPVQGVLRIFTSMFTHANIFHIFFNMYFLWIFGRSVENAIGHKRFLILYLLSGIAASIFYFAFIPIGGYDSLVIPAIGASGAISGILGAYLLLFPNTKLMFCLFFIFIPICIPVSSIIFLIIWFSEQVIYGFLELGGVAYFAHVGGFITGIFLSYVFFKDSSVRLNYHLLMEYSSMMEKIGIKGMPRRIGKWTKYFLTFLFILILLAFSSGTAEVYATNTNIYFLNVTANGQSDVVVLKLYSGKAEVSQSSVDEVRILLNRIPESFICNKELANKNITYREFYNVTINGVSVPVFLDAVFSYRYDGIVDYASGNISTYIVLTDIYGNSNLDGKVNISFNMTSQYTNIKEPLVISSSASILLTIGAIISLFRIEEALSVSFYDLWRERWI
ncbi:rhomboid family intramembrane serine protease [Fervidicoccus fontis]|uniref:Peptidase, family S54 n=2 Tax=Fervidicoccus fontis TaxID=683846 RepID=I0A0N2_FERFK|nr:rhomboid family intramembrane serine protease [Fervidicoccus fontis]AFH42539.1 peptidase, family S54 [Fervidicoccus fontis Kam940]MBE9391150.1 rhomboid family intramembrane serine protease [Fervidicoccus fontis]